MRILIKPWPRRVEARIEMRSYCNAMLFSRHTGDSIDEWATDMRTALDTIDALEAELLHAEALLENHRRRSTMYENALLVATKLYITAMDDFAEIRAYALEHSTTRVIGGAHAALRKIAKIAGGSE